MRWSLSELKVAAKRCDSRRQSTTASRWDTAIYGYIPAYGPAALDEDAVPFDESAAEFAGAELCWSCSADSPIAPGAEALVRTPPAGVCVESPEAASSDGGLTEPFGRSSSSGF